MRPWKWQACAACKGRFKVRSPVDITKHFNNCEPLKKLKMPRQNRKIRESFL